MPSNAWLNVFWVDGIRILREPFYLFLVLMAPFIIGVILRMVVPALTLRFQDRWDLTLYYPLITVIFVIGPSIYPAVVMAFQLLDEKVDNSLLAVAVTPFTLKRFFMLRVLLFATVSVPILVLVHVLVGLVGIPLMKLVAVAVVMSLQSPLMALLVASLATNQVEGFAVMKGVGFAFILPAAMFFVPDYWHVLCGIFPAYWPLAAYFAAVREGGNELFFWLAALVGLIYQAWWVAFLYRRFERNILRS